MSAIPGFRSAMVYMNCPACGDGSEDGPFCAYEFDFDAEDVTSAVEVSMPCDNCGKRICVSLDVMTQALPAADSAR